MYALLDQPTANLIDEAATTDDLYSIVRNEMRAGGDIGQWALVNLDEHGAVVVIASGDDLALMADASTVS